MTRGCSTYFASSKHSRSGGPRFGTTWVEAVRDTANSTVRVAGSLGTVHSPQAGQHLLITHLVEANVGLADGQIGVRPPQHDHVVHLRSEPPLEVGRADRHRHHDPAGTLVTAPARRRDRGPAGGDPVVDQHRGAAVQLQRRAAHPVGRGAPGDLPGLALDLAPDGALVEAEPAQRRVVDRLDALGDRADGQLRVPGSADLARDHHVQRGIEPPRDGGGDDHAAARDAEHDRGFAHASHQRHGQPFASLDPVEEPPMLPDTRSDPLGWPPVEHNGAVVPLQGALEPDSSSEPRHTGCLDRPDRSLACLMTACTMRAPFPPGFHRRSQWAPWPWGPRQRGGLGNGWWDYLRRWPIGRGGRTRRSVLVVTAYILIQTEGGKAAQVAKEISEIKGVQQAEDVTGPYDVIVRAEARNVDDLGKLVVARVQAVDGITRTLTCPVVHL